MLSHFSSFFRKIPYSAMAASLAVRGLDGLNNKIGSQ